MPSTPRTRLPPRLLPALYFGIAQVAFALACLAVARDPRGVSGYFYDSRMLAIVHLVTLGWITASILGSLYVVEPVALHVWIPATWLDYTAFALVVIGIVGMVARFWLEEYGGMAWSAIAVVTGIVLVGGHVARRVRQTSLPRAISAHIMLAFLNVLAAAALGALIGFDKVYHLLPGFALANVFAHAHLAALGWATVMVVAVRSRRSLRSPSSERWPRSSRRSCGCCAVRVRVHPILRTPDPAALHVAASFVSLCLAQRAGTRVRAVAVPGCADHRSIHSTKDPTLSVTAITRRTRSF